MCTCGCLVIQGIPPFNDTTVELIFQHILNHDIPWPEQDVLSVHIRDLMNSLLSLDADVRPVIHPSPIIIETHTPKAVTYHEQSQIMNHT